MIFAARLRWEQPTVPQHNFRLGGNVFCLGEQHRNAQILGMDEIFQFCTYCLSALQTVQKKRNTALAEQEEASYRRERKANEGRESLRKV
jgi:hypothetical protein